jgi:hypothetical protein
VGYDALRANTTATGNTALGYSALTANTIGYSNTALGSQTLLSNTEGNNNLASGRYALYSNTTGSANTALGLQALFTNSTASNNTAVGFQALLVNTTGAENTAVGALALDANVGGSANVSFGYASLTTNTSGNYNTAVGNNALSGNTTASNGVAVGLSALESTTTGINNTACGRGAGRYITTGAYNTMLGSNAGADSPSLRLSTGSGNICLGFACDVAAPGDSYSIVVGYDLTAKGGSTGYYGGSGGVYNEANTSTWSTVSDRRIKKNIEDNNVGLDAIKQIQVKNFEYRTEDEIVDFDNPSVAVVKKEGIQVGVIAQEIEEILPDMIKTQSTGVKSVNPDNLTWYLVNAVKELSAKVEELESQIGV